MILRSSSTIGMNRKVTKRGTICANNTNGRVKLNFFLVKEQLTQTISTITRMMRKMMRQRQTRKALQFSEGMRLLICRTFVKKLKMLFKVQPPFQTMSIVALNGNCIIWKQSTPDSYTILVIVFSSPSELVRSRTTNRTSKMECFNLVHIWFNVFRYYPISQPYFEPDISAPNSCDYFKFVKKERLI